MYISNNHHQNNFFFSVDADDGVPSETAAEAAYEEQMSVGKEIEGATSNSTKAGISGRFAMFAFGNTTS